MAKIGFGITTAQTARTTAHTVTGSDRNWLQDARDELWKLLGDDELRDAVLLVLANKQDLPNAMAVAEVSKHLGLGELRNRHWYIQSACATTDQGIYEGLEWFSKTRASLR